MRLCKVATLCVALLACSATLAAAQQVAGLSPQAAAALASGPRQVVQQTVFEDETPRGPPLAARPTAPKQTPPPGALPPAGAIPPGAVPPGADAKPPEPVCECPIPVDGGGYFGRGKALVDDGCDCKNACQFNPSPSGKPTPSCATLCTCPHNVKVQTFDVKRGAVIREYPWPGKSHGRRLMTY